MVLEIRFALATGSSEEHTGEPRRPLILFPECSCVYDSTIYISEFGADALISPGVGTSTD